MFKRRRAPSLATTSIVVIGCLMLVPLSYLAGWLGAWGQVKPDLTALTKARQQLAYQASREPEEPPGRAPELKARWTATSVTVQWSAISGASQYTIFRADANQSLSNATPIATLSSSKTNYTDNSVAADTAYEYWVSANNGAGQGPLSRGLRIRTYASWSTLAKEGEQAAGTVTAIRWKKSLWGLAGQSSKQLNGPLWNIQGTLVTPLTASQTPSTWFNQTGIRWQALQQNVQAYAIPGQLTRLKGPITLPTLNLGAPTAWNLELFYRQGQWNTAIVSWPLKTAIPDALMLNEYGQVVGVSNANGTLVTSRI